MQLNIYIYYAVTLIKFSKYFSGPPNYKFDIFTRRVHRNENRAIFTFIKKITFGISFFITLLCNGYCHEIGFVWNFECRIKRDRIESWRGLGKTVKGRVLEQ